MRTSRRPLLRGVAVVCATVVVAGCSGSSSPSASRTTPSPSVTPLTASKAKDLAAIAVLTTADLPGYAAKAQTHTAADARSENTMQDCLGAPRPSYLTRNFGTAFTKGTVEVDSSADVAPSAGAATTQLAALKGPQATTCLEQAVKGVLAGSGVTVTSASAAPVPIAVPGSDGSFGYQLTIRATVQGQKLHLVADNLGSLVGQVEIEIGTVSFGSAAFGFDRATALLTKLTQRVRTAY